MSETVTFKVNGQDCALEVEKSEKLIDVLRLRLGLTGTKRGCDDASCGACTVLVNGEARKSCVSPASRLGGAEVLTVEGLARGKRLHPVQEALMESGAVQCGYCTPGIVMELCALFAADPDAGREAILGALEKHLCRCTGYEAILEGALAAQKRLRG
ncbi:MAG TPA: (2Fe-2S)-binding protein [bacterium]|nr:(2Fe-2S)-binding protein [bacterium]HPJ72110.1 (2Fe-2S)-binding protein [bacterium]